MAKPTVYLETTVIGHLVGRLHPDPLVAARQHATRQWWEHHAKQCRLVVSTVVANECREGDPSAAAEHLEVLDSLIHLVLSPQAQALADQLIAKKALPPTEIRDAAHISLAAVNGIEYLLTWNFKHIANPTMQSKIDSTCRSASYEPPEICSPDQLIGLIS